MILPFQNPRRVYCAGPLFNQAERDEMMQIAQALTAGGFEPFVPHADGMEFAKVRPQLIAAGCDSTDVGHWLHSAIFALDVYQVVVGCGSLVFNMNGRVPDEGAVAETTMAWMLGKPIVLFKEDARSAIAGRDNPLIVGQARFTAVTEIGDLAAALAEQVALLQCEPAHRVACPPHLLETVVAGERLWSQLEQLGSRRDSQPVAELVLELFGPGKPVSTTPSLAEGISTTLV